MRKSTQPRGATSWLFSCLVLVLSCVFINGSARATGPTSVDAACWLKASPIFDRLLNLRRISHITHFNMWRTIVATYREEQPCFRAVEKGGARTW